MLSPRPFDLHLSLQTLSYAARLIVSELDTNRLVDRVLDSVADFAHGRRVALLQLAPDGRSAEVIGVMSPFALVDFEDVVRVADTPLAEVVALRKPLGFPLDPLRLVPLPSFEAADAEHRCFCLPLVDSSNAVFAIITVEQLTSDPVSEEELHVLSVLTALAAAALENARLFTLATTDGLTSLYVRRFFDVRLREELARLRRHGGAVALVITDIDHFKECNDAYGHPQGDTVLRELATLFRSTLRHELDIPCRYGGEEYAAILPATDLAGAVDVAERLRRVCEQHPFPTNAAPLYVTLSAGVAVTSGTQPLSFEQLVARADQALYRAKAAGRNRVVADES